MVRTGRLFGSVRLIHSAPRCVNRVMMAHAAVFSQSWPAQRVVRPVRRSSWKPFVVAREGQLGQDSAQLSALLLAVSERQDRAAFRALFVHFAPRLKSYLVRLGSSGTLAEDIVQETMLTLWRKAPMFDPSKAAVSTWVFTIARNLRIDAARRERHPELDPNDPALVPDAPGAPDAGLDQAQYDRRLREAMTHLPREQREIVELSFFADKPHGAIASELGLPLGTVKSRLMLAMGRLRTSLGRPS